IGAVSGFAHPGGNLTGFSTQNFELEEKRFELLRELVPGLGRMVMLGNAPNPYSALALKRVHGLAETAALNFQGVDIDSAGGLEGGGVSVRRGRPDRPCLASGVALRRYPQPSVDSVAGPWQCSFEMRQPP